MIGRLRGKILEKQAPSLLLDVNGVAYEIEASMNTFCLLPEAGSLIVLYIHMLVREDSQTLFGFQAKQERELFRILIKINGVGAKLALTILSGMSVEQFCQCVFSNDSDSLIRLPGVGKKTAQRLLIEVRDRLPRLNQQDLQSALSFDQPISKKQEAISAMVALGYKIAEAQRMIDKIYEEGLSSEALIRLALQSTMQNNKSSVTT